MAKKTITVTRPAGVPVDGVTASGVHDTTDYESLMAAARAAAAKPRRVWDTAPRPATD